MRATGGFGGPWDRETSSGEDAFELKKSGAYKNPILSKKCWVELGG